MKKALLIILLIMVVFTLFAEESAKKKPTWYFISDNQTRFNVNDDVSTDLPELSTVANESWLATGVKFKIGNRFMIRPFIKSVAAWNIDGETGEPALMYGDMIFAAGFHVLPVKGLDIGLALGSTTNFKVNKTIWSGLLTKLLVKVKFPKANVDLVFYDTLKTYFQAQAGWNLQTILVNKEEIYFKFYFLDFIDPRIRTGLFFDNLLKTVSVFNTTGAHTKSSLYHELFTGIITSPLNFLSVKGGFAMYHTVQFGSNGAVTSGTNKVDLGMIAGVDFSLKQVTIGASYQPLFYSAIDGVTGDMKHTFQLDVVIKAKTPSKKS
jgi:hypothetical protein